METILNKAKAYDEAIEMAKRIINVCVDDNTECRSMIACIQQIFPELAESEDEKIRKSLLEYLHTLPNHYSQNGVCAPEWITWIEKQGEQKSFARYKVGDTIYYDSFGRLVSFTIANIVEDGTDNPMYEDKDGNSVFQNDIVEQKLADKVEPKFHEGEWVTIKE